MTMLIELLGRELGLHLWQSTGFALLIMLLLLSLSGPAWLRYLTGLVGLLRFVLPVGTLGLVLGATQWTPLPWSLGDSALQNLVLPPFIVGGDGASGATEVFGLPLGVLLVGIWILGTLSLTFYWLLRLVRAHRALNLQTKPFSPAESTHLRSLAQLSGVNPDKVSGHTTDICGWLGVVGLFRSRIIIPEGLFSRMEKMEVDAVLLHELVHVRRRDNLLRLLQAGVVALFWFHPLVWWLHRRLIGDSERACDEAVLRLTDARDAYASGLCKAVHHALGITLPGVSGMSKTGLLGRVNAVLNHKNRTASPVKNSLVISSLVALVGLTTLFANPPLGTTTDSSMTEPENSIVDVSLLSEVPTVLARVAPLYPAHLKKDNVQGEVVVSFVVDRDGSVTDLQVFRSSDPRFDASACEALKQWKFKAGTKDGVPVRVRLTMPIVFSLRDKK